MIKSFTVTDEVAYEMVLDARIRQLINNGEIDKNCLFQELGGVLSREQIKRVLDQFEELSPLIGLFLSQQQIEEMRSDSENLNLMDLFL